MKIHKYILHQRQQRWNNNENNKLLEIKSTLGEWKQNLKKKKRGNYICHVIAHEDEEVRMIHSPRWTNII